jgi:hypothetical protein
MSQVYLVPIVSTQQAIGGQTMTVRAPKYLNMPTSFTCIQFGGEGYGILVLSAPNASIAAASDCWVFPSDLTARMIESEASALSTFLASINCPADQIASGMTFAAALQVIAKIFLVAQVLHGVSGAPIFSVGTTLSTTVEDSDIAPIATTPIPGSFDFSGVKATDSIGSVLDSLSNQMTQPANLGSL